MFKRYFKKLKNNLVAEPIGSAPRSCKNVPWQPRLSRRKHSFSYYPIYYYEELTMKEIGEVLGITESRVSEIHSKAV